MSEELGLLAAIRETPDDDAPRLVYADWLADHGVPERGDFIRAECEAARLPKWSDERLDAEERAASVFVAGATRWLGKLPVGLDNSITERGFWRFAALEKEEARKGLLNAPPGLDRIAPALDLYMPYDAALFDEVLACPTLEAVQTLRLDGSDFGDGEAQRLARSPHLRGLRHLSLRGQRLTASGVAAILAGLPALQGLDLALAPLGDAGLREMAGLPGLGKLKQLRLSSCQFDDGGAAALLRSRHLGQLEELSLGCGDWMGPPPHLGDRALRELAVPRRLPALRSLTFNEVGAATVDGWRALARSPLAGRLRSLYVRPDTFGADHMEALFHGGRLALESLSLTVFELGLEALEVLLRSPVIRKVRKLDLAQSIGQARGSGPQAAEGARLLADAGLDQLTDLNLSWNKLGNAGARALANGFPSLRSLVLYGNDIGPVGLRALASGRGLGRLARLMVFGNPVGDGGLAALERAAFAPHLQELSIGAAGLTPSAVLQLAYSKAFPRLRWLDLNETPLHPSSVKTLLKSSLGSRLRCLRLGPDDIPMRSRTPMRRGFGARLYLMVPSDY
jgi:uncharacterized protein (TIGR02996 family)